MKRKTIAVLLAATMVLGLTACGGGASDGGSETKAGGGASGSKSGDTIRLVNGKI